LTPAWRCARPRCSRWCPAPPSWSFWGRPGPCCRLRRCGWWRRGRPAKGWASARAEGALRGGPFPGGPRAPGLARVGCGAGTRRKPHRLATGAAADAARAGGRRADSSTPPAAHAALRACF
jgi:hypothetical protein